jgi:molecular chaperone GrpE
VREEQPPSASKSVGVQEVEDQLIRVMADFDNLRKRLGREIELARARERETVATDFLPVLDNLERALDHAESDPSLIRDGIQAVRDQAVQILAKLGFARRDPLGERFDPARHEAVASVKDPDAEPGTIVHVVQPGYGDGEHQLRPAAVVVATRER